MAMRIVGTPDLRVLNTTLTTRFIDAYGDAPIFYPEIVSETESESATGTYPIRAAFPQMREWIGERQLNEIAAHSQVLINKHFELTMGVDRDDIADWSYGSALMDVAALGKRAKQNPETLLTTLMQTGNTVLGYDGKALWAVDHYVNPKKKTGTQANYSPANSGMTLNPANWEAVRTMMNGYVDDEGAPIGVEPNYCMVAPQNRGAAHRIFKAEKDVYGADNVNFGTAKPLVNPWLASDPSTWYALDTQDPLRFAIFQKREWPAQFVMRTQVDSENVFRHRRFEYGVDGRWVVGPGGWFRAYKAMV